MEIITETLTATQWEQEIGHLIEFLQVQGKRELVVSYGWGCDLDMDDLFQEIPMPLSGLREWMVQATVAGIFTFGESNLHIYSRDKEIEFILGHECDIELTTENRELAQEVASGWKMRGFTSYEVLPKQAAFETQLTEEKI